MSKEHSATGAPASGTQAADTQLEKPKSDSIFGNTTSPVVEVLPVTPIIESELETQSEPPEKGAAELSETPADEFSESEANCGGGASRCGRTSYGHRSRSFQARG